MRDDFSSATRSIPALFVVLYSPKHKALHAFSLLLLTVIRLSLGDGRLVNLLPVAQRTNAFTNGVVGKTMGRWS